MTGFTLLWSKILDSSIWIKGSKETRLVWITLLAMKDYQGRISSSVVGLADRAKVSEDECRKALRVLLAPDPDDTSKVEAGRRIREVQGGWEIINHDFYRFSTEAKREFWRQQKAEQREFQKAKGKEYTKRIRRIVKDEGTKAGARQAIGEAVSEWSQPPGEFGNDGEPH